MESLPYILQIFTIILLIILTILYIKRGKHIKDLEEHSLKSEELKTRFLTHFCQVLRFPLNAINQNCQSITDDNFRNLPDEEIQKIQNNIDQNSHLLLIYLNELQELTNFQGAIPSLSVIEVNLYELVMSYRREIMHETHPGVSVSIHTTMSPHAKATFDTTMFRQLIMHLLRIGAQRTKEGSISIDYEMERDGLRFKLSDTGGPIPEEIRKRLFTDKFKEEYITQLDAKATHVSLEISKFIIESMHGTIKVQPTEDGKGVMANFWFPCPIRTESKPTTL